MACLLFEADTFWLSIKPNSSHLSRIATRFYYLASIVFSKKVPDEKYYSFLVFVIT